MSTYTLRSAILDVTRLDADDILDLDDDVLALLDEAVVGEGSYEAAAYAADFFNPPHRVPNDLLVCLRVVRLASGRVVSLRHDEGDAVTLHPDGTTIDAVLDADLDIEGDMVDEMDWDNGEAGNWVRHEVTAESGEQRVHVESVGA